MNRYDGSGLVKMIGGTLLVMLGTVILLAGIILGHTIGWLYYFLGLGGLYLIVVIYYNDIIRHILVSRKIKKKTTRRE